MSALVEGNDAQAVAALLAPGGSGGTSGRTAGNAPPGRVVLKAVGVPGEGMVSLATMDAGDLTCASIG